MKFSLNIDEGRFRSQLEKLVMKQIKAGCRGGMKHVMGAVHAAAVPLTPVDKGNLRRSERWRIEGEGFDVVGILEAHTSYAQFVHDGTGLYGPLKKTIEVWRRNPGSLRTRSGGGGVHLFRSRGMRGTPFFELAIIKLESQLPWIFMRGFFAAID